MSKFKFTIKDGYVTVLKYKPIGYDWHWVVCGPDDIQSVVQENRHRFNGYSFRVSKYGCLVLTKKTEDGYIDCDINDLTEFLRNKYGL